MIPVKGFVCLARTAHKTTTFFGPSTTSEHKVQNLKSNGIRVFDTIQEARYGQSMLSVRALLEPNLKFEEITLGRINMQIVQNEVDLETIKLADSFCVIGTSSTRSGLDFSNVEFFGKFTEGATRMFDSGSRLGDHGIHPFTTIREAFNFWKEYIRQSTYRATIARIFIVSPQ